MPCPAGGSRQTMCRSRGGAVDLTPLYRKTGKEPDMGSPFDRFSEASHPADRGLTGEQGDKQYKSV